MNYPCRSTKRTTLLTLVPFGSVIKPKTTNQPSYRLSLREYVSVALSGPGFDTRSGNILSFLLPLLQEGQLSVTVEKMCTKYWLTA